VASDDNAAFTLSASPDMRAFLTLGSLLIVLAVVALSVRSQLQANKRFLPSTAAASGVASMPLNGSPQQVMSQYQRELDQAMKAGAQHTADQAASAADLAR
jgi:hypothetical protein